MSKLLKKNNFFYKKKGNRNEEITSNKRKPFPRALPAFSFHLVTSQLRS